MNLDLGPGDIALLTATVGSDLGKQAEWCLKQIRKILNRQPDTLLLHEFESDFWPNYPRRKDKGHARTAFIRARSKIDMGALLRGLAQYSLSVRGKEERFICLPATWLNGERWTDVYPEEKSSPQSTGLSTADPNYGFRSQVQHYIKTGRWCFRGTAPTDPTCLIPREVLREFEVVFREKGLAIPALL